jgi:hypothetical protein
MKPVPTIGSQAKSESSWVKNVLRVVLKGEVDGGRERVTDALAARVALSA